MPDPPTLYSCDGCPPGKQCVWCRWLEAARTLEADALERAKVIAAAAIDVATVTGSSPAWAERQIRRLVRPVTAIYPIERLLSAEELDDAQAEGAGVVVCRVIAAGARAQGRGA